MIIKNKFQNLVGQKFGRLTVLSRAENKNKKTYWLCQCTCSQQTIIIVYASNLKRGNTKSCGCLKKEKPGRLKHKLCTHQLYQTWANIIKRTTNANATGYKNYGGRGIKICDQWRHTPKAFIEYCMTLVGWDNPDLSIDRIDNNRNYEPGNLRFASRLTQSLNRRTYSNTGEKHISFNCNSQRYIVARRLNGKVKNFGSFKTLQEAIDCKKKNNLVT